MHRLVVLRLGEKKVHLLKLIGAFIMIAAAIMVLSSVYKLLWVASIMDVLNKGGTQAVTLNLDGITITETLQANDFGTQMGLFLPPIAYIMFWCGVMIAGTIIYRSGGLVPIEEIIGKKKR